MGKLAASDPNQTSVTPFGPKLEEKDMESDEILESACNALVGLFRDQVQSGRNCVHSRIFNYVLHPEANYVGCGRSISLSEEEKAHPEHIVPCSVLVGESFRLIKEGVRSDEEIAGMLQRHWKIAQITKAEARFLDSDLKLKSKMPSGWRFEDGDTFARLDAAGITLVSDS